MMQLTEIDAAWRQAAEALARRQQIIEALATAKSELAEAERRAEAESAELTRRAAEAALSGSSNGTSPTSKAIRATQELQAAISARIIGLERALAEHDQTIIPVAAEAKRAHTATIRIATDAYLAEYLTAAEAFVQVVARGIALARDLGITMSGLQQYRRIVHPQLIGDSVAAVERQETDGRGHLVSKLIVSGDPELQRLTHMANELTNLAKQIQESIRAEDQRRKRDSAEARVLYV